MGLGLSIHDICSGSGATSEFILLYYYQATNWAFDPHFYSLNPSNEVHRLNKILVRGYVSSILEIAKWQPNWFVRDIVAEPEVGRISIQWRIQSFGYLGLAIIEKGVDECVAVVEA